MKLKPLKAYKKPLYPKENMFALTDKAKYPLLSISAITTALTLFLLTPRINGDKYKYVVKTELNKDKKAIIKTKQNYNISEFLAPIFMNGEGRGSTGCIACNPPIFVSESDARDIIFERFSKMDISFEETNKTFEGLNNNDFYNSLINKRYIQRTVEDNYYQKELKSKQSIPITIDFYSRKHNLGIIYINYDDFTKYSFNGEGLSSFVQRFDLLKLADCISNEIQEYNKFHCAIFYDPLVFNIDTKNNASLNIDWDKYSKLLDNYKSLSLKEKDELDQIEKKNLEIMYNYQYRVNLEVLKTQVNDFINWYKKENPNLGEKN